MRLRTLLEELQIDLLVASCLKEISFPREQIREAIFSVLAKMLVEEEQYNHRFESLQGLIGYVRLSAIRKLYKEAKKHQGQVSIQDIEPLLSPGKTPEEKIIVALELQRFSELLHTILQEERRNRQDFLLLIEVLTASPERFVHQRSSGKKKGTFVFRYLELAKELSWDKSRVCRRLEELRQLLLKEMKKRGKAS